MGKLSMSLLDNREMVERMVKDCDDILIRPMKLGKEMQVDCFLVYIETAVSNMMLEDSVIGKLLVHLRSMEEANLYETIEKNALGISDTKELQTMEEAVGAMLAGNAVLFIDHYDRAWKIGSKGYPGAGVLKAESEKVLRGSKEAFSESEKVNTALIRKRIKDTRLKVKEKPLGVTSNTMTAIVYMEELVCPEILFAVERRLEKIKVDGLLDSGILEQLTEETWYSPFPQYQTTERPDKAAMAVLEGRVVLVVDNSPEALILPATVNTLFQTSDDYYRHFLIVSFLRLVRYAAAFLAVSLPAFYVAVMTWHPRILPVNLVTALAEARAGVPFPTIIEVLLLELSFELLREAGLRMPGPIGNTIGIVGGLIVGQAAVSANLVSPMVVVVVAMTALGSFSIPNEEFSESCRLLKYGMLLLAGFFGILGVFFGWFLIVGHLSRLKSFGIAYLEPYVSWEINQKADIKDSLVRFPMIFLKRRPVFVRKSRR